MPCHPPLFRRTRCSRRPPPSAAPSSTPTPPPHRRPPRRRRRRRGLPCLRRCNPPEPVQSTPPGPAFSSTSYRSRSLGPPREGGRPTCFFASSSDDCLVFPPECIFDLPSLFLQSPQTDKVCALHNDHPSVYPEAECVIICVLMFSKNHEWAGYSRADTRTSTTTGAIIWIELD